MGLLAALALPASARGDVELDPATDTVRVAGRLDGTLTRPAAGAAAPIGLAYVRENRRALGLTAADLETLGKPEVRSDGGIRQVRWRQQVDGITVADAELRVNVDADGRVINVLGSPATDLPEDTTPLLGKPDPDAELTIFQGRLSYRYVDEAASDEIYDTISDADTGKVLKRTNLVKSATGRVWENYPGAPFGGTAVSKSLDRWLTETTRLEGPWVYAYLDSHADVTGTVTNVAPGEYALNTTWPDGIGCSVEKPCSWDGSASSKTTNRQQSTVQAFYLANRFRDHLAAAPISFDEFSGATDKIRLETGNGNGLNNANMYTPPRGQQPRMQMYYWSGDGHRSVNSADDASILFHEYAHGLTGRLVTDADGVQALGSRQAGAMGEAWSDFYAKDYLVSQGYEVDTSTPGEIDMGVYMDAVAHSTRTAAIDCPRGSSPAVCARGGYTYGDFATVAGRPQFHSDGEIWGQTLWDLRTAMAPDTDATLAIVTQALRLSPPEPSFLDMRNAILQADTALFAGAHHATIWAVFANRGMGFYASTTGSQDVRPVPNFSLPPAAGGPTGTVTGVVTADGAPLAGIEVGLGGPDSLTATTGPDGRYTLQVPVQDDAVLIVRGTSKLQLATGYEQEFLRDVDVAAGAVVTRNAELRRNWAVIRAGASVTSTTGTNNALLGCGPKQAVDGLLGSVWSAPVGSAGSLDVKLPRAVDVTSVGADPGAACGDGDGSATRNYSIAVSPDGITWTTVRTGTFSAADNGRMNRFALDAPARGMQYARITPTSTQGNSGGWIDLAEFAVYGTPSFEARILSGPSGPVAAATFTFDGSGVSSFECRVLGVADWGTCLSGVTYSPPDGTYTFELRGVSGGETTPVVSRQFTINRQLPETAFTSTPPALTNASSVAFGFTGGTSYQCSLDGAAFVACTSGQSWAVADGPHTFAVRARNNAGDDLTPATYAFTVDATPPDTVITWAPPPILTTRDFSLAFTASEAATFTCALDGGAARACTSPFPLTGLGDGAHSVVVTATDAAGNTATARSDFTVLVPGLPPAPTPTATATPTATPKRNALTSATVPKTVSRRTGKVKVTVRGVRGAKVAVQAKVGSRVVGKTTKTLRGTSLAFQLKLDRKRLKTGATVTVRVQATGTGLQPVTRTLKFRLKA